jgi:hypothetical protein
VCMYVTNVTKCATNSNHLIQLFACYVLINAISYSHGIYSYHGFSMIATCCILTLVEAMK